MTTMRFLSFLLALVAFQARADITANGQVKKAQLELLSSDPTGKDGRIYYNNSTDLFKWYDLTTTTWRVAVDTTTSQTLTNKTLTSPKLNENVAVTTTATQVNYLSAATGTTGTTSSNVVFSALPNIQSVTLSGSGAIYTSNQFIDGSTPTKKLQFDLSGATAAKTMTLASSHTNDRTVTFPDATDTLVGKDTTDTLTNKTLTLPKLNENVAVTTTATKLNYLTSATGTTGTASTNVVFSTSPVVTTPTVRTSLTLQNASGSQPTLLLSEDPDNGTNSVTIQSNASIADYTLTLPVDDGNSGEVLTTDGTGVLSWAAALTSTLSNGKILVGNGSNVATAVTPTGDVTITNAGVTAIASGVIVNADINASAAIDGSKIVVASGSTAGVVDGNTASWAGAKTFTSAVTSQSGYRSIRDTQTTSGTGSQTIDFTNGGSNLQINSAYLCNIALPESGTHYANISFNVLQTNDPAAAPTISVISAVNFGSSSITNPPTSVNSGGNRYIRVTVDPLDTGDSIILTCLKTGGA